MTAAELHAAPTPPSESTLLAADRTRLAQERTLMAWIRTATSMITFGFTIYKFFQEQRIDPSPTARSLFGPRNFAAIMISIGLIALLLATIQHRKEMKALRARYGSGAQHSLSVVVATLITSVSRR